LSAMIVANHHPSTEFGQCRRCKTFITLSKFHLTP
jgi:hypothetical protein